MSNERSPRPAVDQHSPFHAKRRRRLSPVVLDEAARDCLTKKIENTWQKYYHKYYSCASTNPEIVLEMQKEYLRSYKGFFKDDPYFEYYYVKLARPEDLREALTLRIDRGSPGPDPDASSNVPVVIPSERKGGIDTRPKHSPPSHHRSHVSSNEIERIQHQSQPRPRTPPKHKLLDSNGKTERPSHQQVKKVEEAPTNPDPESSQKVSGDDSRKESHGKNHPSQDDEEVRKIAEQLLKAAKESEKLVLPPPLNKSEKGGAAKSTMLVESVETKPHTEPLEISQRGMSLNPNPFSSEGGIGLFQVVHQDQTEPVITSTTQGYPIDKLHTDGRSKSVLDRLGAQRRKRNGVESSGRDYHRTAYENKTSRREDGSMKNKSYGSRDGSKFPQASSDKSHPGPGPGTNSSSAKHSVTARLGPPSKASKSSSDNAPQVRIFGLQLRFLSSPIHGIGNKSLPL